MACLGCNPSKTYNGKILKVKRAPEPLDVFWENLGYKTWEVFKLRSLSIIASILILALSFGAILGIKSIQVKVHFLD